MARKGIDSKFLHYGIREQDLQIIEELCKENGLDIDLVKEKILRKYHEMKVNDIELRDSDINRLLNNALQTIK